MPRTTLRILSLNIWNYNAPWNRRRDLILETVLDAKPDLIGFQEIRHHGALDEHGMNQAQQLAQHLPDYRYIYQPAQRNPEIDEWEGLATFSRLPFKSSSFISLTRDPNDSRDNHQRLVLHAEVQTSAGPMHFFDTHSSLSQNARRRNVREITQFVERHTGPLPRVLVGDFNEIADEDPIRHLTRDAGFLDAWAQIHPNDPGWTYSTANRYVNEKRETDSVEGRRIDYIFVKPEVEKHGRILSCKIVADNAAKDGHFPSDHFGVVADINLEKS